LQCLAASSSLEKQDINNMSENYKFSSNLNSAIAYYKYLQDINAEHNFQQALQSELLKPASVAAEVKSLFEQYALLNDDSQWLFTPEVPLRQKAKPEENLYICHLYEQGIFAVMNRLSEESMHISIPKYSFSVGEKPAILDGNFDQINNNSEIKQARQVVEHLKEGYRQMVRDLADSINLAKYLHTSDGEIVLDAVMLFYLNGDNPFAKYMPVIVDITHPSVALETAIDTFYEAYGEHPTPETPSPLELRGVEILVNNIPRPIDSYDMHYFSGLFRELTTFDSDRHIGMQIDSNYRMKPKFN
jgi:hypothetical protein